MSCGFHFTDRNTFDPDTHDAESLGDASCVVSHDRLVCSLPPQLGFARAAKLYVESGPHTRTALRGLPSLSDPRAEDPMSMYICRDHSNLIYCRNAHSAWLSGPRFTWSKGAHESTRAVVEDAVSVSYADLQHYCKTGRVDTDKYRVRDNSVLLPRVFVRLSKAHGVKDAKNIMEDLVRAHVGGVIAVQACFSKPKKKWALISGHADRHAKTLLSKNKDNPANTISLFTRSGGAGVRPAMELCLRRSVLIYRRLIAGECAKAIEMVCDADVGALWDRHASENDTCVQEVLQKNKDLLEMVQRASGSTSSAAADQTVLAFKSRKRKRSSEASVARRAAVNRLLWSQLRADDKNHAKNAMKKIAWRSVSGIPDALHDRKFSWSEIGSRFGAKTAKWRHLEFPQARLCRKEEQWQHELAACQAERCFLVTSELPIENAVLYEGIVYIGEGVPDVEGVPVLSVRAGSLDANRIGLLIQLFPLAIAGTPEDPRGHDTRTIHFARELARCYEERGKDCKENVKTCTERERKREWQRQAKLYEEKAEECNALPSFPYQGCRGLRASYGPHPLIETLRKEFYKED